MRKNSRAQCAAASSLVLVSLLFYQIAAGAQARRGAAITPLIEKAATAIISVLRNK